MKTISTSLALLLTLVGLSTTAAQEQPNAPQYFNQEVAQSNPLRTKQARELDEYIKQMAGDRTRFKLLFKPDYSSPATFEKSAEPLRQAFCDSIGYPPPGRRPQSKATFTVIGLDSIGTYYRAMIPILPAVHSEGIYIVPKELNGKAPLMISMHGGGGSAEVALFNGGANYHGMIRDAVKQGYVVYAPQHLFRAEGYPRDIRRQIDDRMRLIGTSITAVEVAKITSAIDELVKRPEVDADRIGMVGLSYGGYYAQVTPAIDKRIKVSVSSCYYGVQEGRYEARELSVPTDFRFQDRFALFNDADIVALVCPRAHQIQAGARDNASHREKGKSLAPISANYYKQLKLPDKFEHVIFAGGHEFDDESAWAFVKKHL
ncbi:MAG: dienelactone hydrolase family protein [Pirellulaceae bacterium]